MKTSNYLSSKDLLFFSIKMLFASFILVSSFSLSVMAAEVQPETQDAQANVDVVPVTNAEESISPSTSTGYFDKCTYDCEMYGAYLGVSYNDVVTKSDADFKGTLGYRVGFVSRTFINDSFGLRLGFNFNMRLLESEFAGVTTEYMFSFFDFPLLVEYRLNSFISAFVGPSFSISMTNDIDVGGNSARLRELKTFYPLGTAGLSFNLKEYINIPLGFDVYYERGLNSLIRRAAPTQYSNYGVNAIWWF